MITKRPKKLSNAMEEIKKLINNREEHVIKLLNTCATTDQLEQLHEYTTQLWNSIQQLSTHYNPSFWWKEMYQKEVQFRLSLSAGNIHVKINQKYIELEKN